MSAGSPIKAPPPIRTREPRVEVAWFSALCGDDYEFLGVPDGTLRSSFNHCSSIVRRADELGYQNILMPSGWACGQETLPFSAATAVLTKQINHLVAVRMGEIHPPMLARHLATIDHILEGRLTVNIISSDLPGMREESSVRYARSREVIEILKQCWTGTEPPKGGTTNARPALHHRGRFYQLDLSTTAPAAPYQQNGGPLLYFGGISPDAVQLCAEHCDVFLMWPETEERLSETMHLVAKKAAALERVIDYGLRIHVIVRETESEARDAARRLLSRLDPAKGLEIKARAQDHQSAGVRRQDELRAKSQDDYIEPFIWSGIGRARSGCASAIVGDPEQVLAKLQRYIAMGIRALILSGYPHLTECELFARYVLPRLDTCKLNEVQGRKPKTTPATPLTTALRF
jgi:alkanesulfonate monooxygenase